MDRLQGIENTFKILAVNPRGRALGSPIHRWDGNSKLDLTEIVCEDVMWH
jgi:hypothetical protein